MTIQGNDNEFYNLTNYEWGYKVSTFILINLPTLLLYVKFGYSTLSTINQVSQFKHPIVLTNINNLNNVVFFRDNLIQFSQTFEFS